MYTEDIIAEIDATLEKLIHNAEAMQRVNLSDLTEAEISAFEKTQESLLHHFMYMDQTLETKRKNLRNLDKRSISYKIQEKTQRFKKLNDAVNQTIEKTTKTSPLFGKRRSKRLLSLFK